MARPNKDPLAKNISCDLRMTYLAFKGAYHFSKSEQGGFSSGRPKPSTLQTPTSANYVECDRTWLELPDCPMRWLVATVGKGRHFLGLILLMWAALTTSCLLRHRFLRSGSPQAPLPRSRHEQSPKIRDTNMTPMTTLAPWELTLKHLSPDPHA